MTSGSLRRSLAPADSGRLALALAALLGVAGCGDERDAGASALADCAGFAGAGFGGAKCGVIEVFEQPDASEGPTIGIAVLVVPASGDNPASDPVFVLAGGPGQGAASLAQWVAPRLESLSRDRDLVFVDLRGTGASGALDCPFEDYEDLGEMLAAEFHPERLADCLASYGEVDLRHYSTEAQMADLELVRAKLGYEQINLLAISYGTRAALTYLRRHPERVRAMVLDGVVPLDHAIYPEIPASSEQALAHLLADCRDDDACGATYPGLERELEQVLAELDTQRRLVELPHPRTGAIERVDVTRTGFLGALRMALYSAESAALIPLMIHAAHRGDFGPIAALTLRSGKHAKTLSLGLYLTVSCAEELAGLDEATIRAATAELRWFDAQSMLDLRAACERWRPAAPPPDFRTPTHAAAPTLLLSGRYDPVTPPRFGDQVAAQLGDARHVVVESGHHGMWWRGCAPSLMAEFFADPRPAALDVECLVEQPARRFFLGPNGPRRLGTRDAAAPLLGDERLELASKETDG